MVLLFVLVAIAIVAAVAVLVVRDAPLMPDDPTPGRPLRWPLAGPVAPADLAEVRFSIAVRGYRMDEVDRVLDDARAALLERDRRIAEFETGGAAVDPEAAETAVPLGAGADARADSADSEVASEADEP
ncbi:MAG: DivIVA domain-containing protein [Candidatus Nanopelagicales bacterium]